MTPFEHGTAAAMRIWIVEDDAGFREALAHLVTGIGGMQCAREFGDCESLVEAFETEPASAWPAVILMDVNLPGMSGVDCAARLKALSPDLAVVMLTIRDDADTIFEALRAGASGYLLKDASIDQITAAIRQAADGGMLMSAPVARRVQEFFHHPPLQQPAYGLSGREKAVLEKMAEGLGQKEIADRLFISPSTVNSHIQRIYQKLHVNSSSGAVAKAIRERLV